MSITSYANTPGPGPKVVQVVGYKNTGKSTLTAALTREFSNRGLRVAVIKHDGHDHFQMDREGTDSHRFAEAGAGAVAVMSDTRTAILEKRAARLEDMLHYFKDYDWVLIEGHKQAPYPKLVMARSGEDLLLVQQLERVIGVVSWFPKEEVQNEADFDGQHVIEIDNKGIAWHSVHEPGQVANVLLSSSR
ncbi:MULTISPECIES: molybdopterin-guanine dinucleotide biosynthesis protein B [unclassified Paenibacillus]|uniref:molybdopterin-guanine dinucleotide biosynthesis protein B n=1 Tax=unclassified Paenibacillus TaxID=185978 RepID=UPI001F393D5F|nr:molybdopterin-guanine dinucleotide biosynthesis protein B [Paenibacillus sp. JJ-223]CAH1190949.1 hypothetical protein PAECIP111890_00232 [Paenibacillus sp. JJ-223]